MGNWWIVMLPDEEASLSEVYGPFRSHDAAQKVADKWNREYQAGPNYKYDPDYQAEVVPIRAARELPTPTH